MPVFPPRLSAFAFTAFLLCCPLPAAAQPAAPDAGALAQMRGLLRDYVEQQVLQRGLEGDIHVQFDTAKLDAQPACTEAEAFLGGQGTLRSRFSVGLRCLAPAHWVAYVPVQLRVMGQYPVAARPLAPNTVLGESDVTLREGDLMRLPAGAAVALEDVLGYTTVQRIAANQALKHNTLQAPHSVLRGQAVTLEVRGDGFTATGEGTAVQSGEPGAVIQVRTPSGQVVHGRVLNAQTVILAM